jgi:hypothetical protein
MRSEAPVATKHLKWASAFLATGAAVYLGYVGTAWLRYGRRGQPSADADPLLDQFMPSCEVAARHQIRVAAPAAVTFAAARNLDLSHSIAIGTIFKARELLLGAKPDRGRQSPALVDQMKALGWGVLAEIPDTEIIMGAATQPWLADVVFRAIPADDFVNFDEPGYVKIAWTIRVDEDGPLQSVAKTETRVTTTDGFARRKFRVYWSFLSPGIILIRHLVLAAVKREAERW